MAFQLTVYRYIEVRWKLTMCHTLASLGRATDPGCRSHQGGGHSKTKDLQFTQSATTQKLNTSMLIAHELWKQEVDQKAAH